MQFKSLRSSPYFTLLLWVLPLVLLRSAQQSLMAHDEGIYAMQARSFLLTGDWITPQWGGGFRFDRTIGIQWLMAGCYSLLGVSEGSARLPSAIAWILSVLLTYKIGSYLLNPRLAWLGAAIFSVIPLVVQYGRLATQDMVLVWIELVAIWALLEAERQRKKFWGFVAGACLGLGFLIKGFMVIPAAIALLPYLIGHHRRHRHLLNPALYVGLVVGMVPTLGWLWVATQRYGVGVIQTLFGKLFSLGGQTYLGAGPDYYFWNIPANGFPWVFFALGGLWLTFRNAEMREVLQQNQSRLLLVGYPVTLFVELTLFGTRTHYYPLQLMPFVGLLGAIALNHLVTLYANRQKPQLFKTLHVVLAALAAILLAAIGGIAFFTPIDPTLERGLVIALILALGWFSLFAIWLSRNRIGAVQSAQQWLAVWLLTSWIALATLNVTGWWGNYEARLKTFLQQPNVQDVLRSHPVKFVVDKPAQSRSDRKTHLLLNFYTPQPGAEVQFSQLSPQDYAWVDPILKQSIPPDVQRIDTFKEWTLIRK